MGQPIGLVDYLKKECPRIDLTKQSSDFYKDPPEFDELVSTLKIVPSDTRPHAYTPKEGLDYTELIDQIVTFLVTSNSKNVLRNGYFNYSGNVASAGSNFAVDNLKEVQWRLLFSKIGCTNFVKLLLNNKGYVKTKSGDHVQVFGDINYRLKSAKVTISKSKMLYKSVRCSQNDLRLLPLNIYDLQDQIFPEMPKRRLSNFRKLLSLAIARDAKTNYRSLFHNLTDNKPIDKRQSFLEQSCKISSVIRLVLVVTGKLFPVSIWGSPHNKAVIHRHIIAYLKSGKYDKITTKDLSKLIKLSDIQWLGKTDNISSKQDFIVRQQVFLEFLSWFFEAFLNNAISRFWYVTESPQPTKLASSGLLYFDHMKWRFLTRDWIQNYIDENLLETGNNKDNKQMAQNEKFNYGDLRLIPKKNDFRPLCVPHKKPFIPNTGETLTQKQFEAQRKEYESNKYNIILPVLQLIHDKNRTLLKLKTEHHARSYSLYDVTYQIQNFKRRLLTTHEGKFPKLFMLKLDMKHCYDKLNQGKIVECFVNLFSEDESEKTYYIGRAFECSEFNLLHKKLKSLTKDHSSVQDLNALKNSFTRGSSRIIIDKNSVTRLSRSQVLDTIRNQVLHSTIRIGKKLYKRKQGVFQGFPLLGTFCDMVYNSLVDELLGFLLKSPTPSLLIRLVDDFLFVSEDKDQCRQVYDVLTSTEARQFGAFVNEEKTAWINFDDNVKQEIRFVGLTIDCQNLEIKKGLENMAPISLSSKLSFKATYKFLSGLFRSRLKPSLLDLELVSSESLLFNLDAVFGPTIDAFYEAFKTIERSDKFEQEELLLFLFELLEYTLETYFRVNKTTIHFPLLTTEFVRLTWNAFNRNVEKFQKVIEWISALSSLKYKY